MQTFNPDHPAILAAVRHDYHAFAAYEMPMRKLLSYPPFAAMVRLVVRGPVEKTTEEFTAHVAERLTVTAEKPRPKPRPRSRSAPFAKLRGKFRFQIQLQSPLADKLHAAVAEATKDLKAPEEASNGLWMWIPWTCCKVGERSNILHRQPGTARQIRLFLLPSA